MSEEKINLLICWEPYWGAESFFLRPIPVSDIYVMGIVSFKNKETELLAQGVVSKVTLRLLPEELHGSAMVKIQILRYACKLTDLRNFPGLKLEQLKGRRRDEYSIRINRQYRICFKWLGSDVGEVGIEDYH